MNLKVALALLCALAVPAAGQAPRPTVQQQFDAAQAAHEARNWREALRQLDTLETRARNNPRTLAIVRVRRGTVLVELGRIEEAAAAIREGLPALPANDATLTVDRFQGLLALGLIAEHELDYPEALRQYRLAAALPVADADRLPLARGTVQTQLFSDAQGALRDADAALRLAAAAAAGNRAIEAQFHTLKGRALLNLARFPEAQEELELAMRQLGNLTLRVDMNDLVARSDLTIAALLAGDEERARRYLAYTGAGRFRRGSLIPHSVDLPQCGGDLAPDDVAVIQFGLADDGRVTYAMPIYASRQGPAALAFARAVRRWAFAPRGAGDVPALLRAAVRIEVRCSSLADPDGDVEDGHTLLPRLIAADRTWARGVAAGLNRPTAALRAELASLERAAEPGPRGTLPLLLILGDRGDVPFAERSAFLRRALAVAAAQQAPAAIVAGIAIAAGRPQVPRVWIGSRSRSDAPDFDAILAYPEVRASPQVIAMVRLARARNSYYEEEHDRALATAAAAVGALPDLAPTDPLRQEAAALSVAAHAARGDMEAARSAHRAMGANAPRCGVQPRHRRTSAGSGDFPRDALRWGFEGWAANELSLTPGGDVTDARTVMAYPPFVFGEAARRVARRSRYDPTFIPDGAPCTYDRQRVIFALPG